MTELVLTTDRPKVVAFVPRGTPEDDYVVLHRASGEVIWQTWRRESIEALDGAEYEVMLFARWARERLGQRVQVYGK